MTEQEKIDQFNRDVEGVLKGNVPEAGTDSQRLDAARQLAAADFSANSHARATTRARLLARANRELPVQNKRKEMNTKFSGLFRTLAFGAFLLMMVFGLGWVLSNTTPQVGVGIETPGVEVTEIVSPNVPVGFGEIYLVLDGNNPSNPGFAHLAADCLVEDAPCPTPEVVPGTPKGSLNTTFEWSPDFSKMIAISTYFEPQVWMFNRDGQTWVQMATPLFSNPVWSPDGNWLVGMSSVKVNPTSNALLLTRADGSEWEEILTDFQGIQTPIGWLNDTNFLFAQTYREENGVLHDMFQIYGVEADTITSIADISHQNSILTGIDLSPDRTQVAYVLMSTGEDSHQSEITVLQIANSGPKTTTLEGSWTKVSWSPDGKWLALSAGANATCQVQLVRPDGSESINVFTGDWVGNCEAIWSPDGQYVLVPASALANKTTLYVINASDKSTRQIEIQGVGVQNVLPRVSWVPAVGSSLTLIPTETATSIFRSEANHLEVTVPAGWAAYEGEEYIANPFTGVAAFNSWGETGFWVKEKATQTQNGQSFTYNPNVVLEQIPQDGAYIVLVWQSGGPAIVESGALGSEYAGIDLSGLWQPGDCREHTGQYLDFYKFERILRLEIYCGPQASEDTVQAVNSLLSSWNFDNSQSEISDPQPPTPLTLDSDSETIRQRILLSHTFWQALWADAQITDYVSGTPAVQRVQVWLNQPAQARVLSGKADGTPATLWISDGQMTRTGEDLSGYGLENFVPPMTESDTVYPPPMTGIMPTPLSNLLFPSGLAQRGGTYRPIALETVAGRETLVVEWNRPDGPLTDRFWVDTVTGVILHEQNYGKGGDGALTYEYLITHLQYDLNFQPETFNRLAPFPPVFATGPEDIFSAVATPVPEGEPDTSLASGEIYLLLSKASGYETAGLVHFPANCLISGEPCPPVEFLADVPAGLQFPIGWSPDYQQAIFPVSVFEEQMWRFQRDTQTWTLLEMPYLIGVVWAPDGQWMVGQPSMYGNQEFNPFLIANANGSDAYEILADHPGFENVLAWLDNTRIFIWNNLESDTSEEDYTVYDEFQIYNTISQEVEVITGVEWDMFSENLVPSVSPDKAQLIYTLSPRNSNSSTVTRINLNDLSQTSFSLPISIWDLSWSPVGEWLALTVYVGSTCELHLVHPDGSDLHRVLEWPGTCFLEWSPDGQYILVPALTQTPTIPRLYVINVATGESRLVELPDVGVEFEWPVVSWVP